MSDGSNYKSYNYTLTSPSPGYVDIQRRRFHPAIKAEAEARLDIAIIPILNEIIVRQLQLLKEASLYEWSAKASANTEELTGKAHDIKNR